MLVLTRKTNESIMLGPEICVTVLSIGQDRVRLGISAPIDTVVARKEIFESLREKRERKENGDT